MAANNDSNLMGAVAYLFGIITGVILFFVKPDDKYVKYHAVQSILLTVVVWIVFTIVGLVVTMATVATLGLGAIVGIGILGILNLLVLLLWLYCMWKAYSGEKFKLPVLGDLAEQHSK